MNSVALLLAVIVAACSSVASGRLSSEAASVAAQQELEWNNYISTFGKSYKTKKEQAQRKEIFMVNNKFVNDHNANPNNSYTLAVNQFADQTNKEFVAKRNGFNAASSPPSDSITNLFSLNPLATLPNFINWTASGNVTPVKDQGQCGSCWAFSATGGLESVMSIKTGKLPSLSEQNLMDCSGNYGNQACNGGLMTSAYKYVIANKGIDTEASYPYTAMSGTTCMYSITNKGAACTNYTNIPSGNEAALQQAIVQRPVCVAIDASKRTFQLYSSGVYNEPSCSTTALDHGVLAVGYGTQAGKQYYIVKNSWGVTWGENGYIRMSRNINNQCGIASMATYPNV